MTSATGEVIAALLLLCHPTGCSELEHVCCVFSESLACFNIVWHVWRVHVGVDPPQKKNVSSWELSCDSCSWQSNITGWWFGCHFLIFPEILGFDHHPN